MDHSLTDYPDAEGASLSLYITFYYFYIGLFLSFIS
jgi:hypothetical protein